MKEKQAEREYAHILIEMMKDLDGFKIVSLDYERNSTSLGRLENGRRD